MHAPRQHGEWETPRDRRAQSDEGGKQRNRRKRRASPSMRRETGLRKRRGHASGFQMVLVSREGCLRLTGWLFGIILRKRKFLFRPLPQRLEGIAIRIGRRRLETRIRHRGGRLPVLVMRWSWATSLTVVCWLIYPPFHHEHHRSGGGGGC